jgi:hypothetical protein
MLKLIAFILVIIGTAGLLLNDFVFDWGRIITLVLAGFSSIGFVTLVFFYLRKRVTNG